MSTDQLLAEILNLPAPQRQSLLRQAIDSLPDVDQPDPLLTPGLLAELDRRYHDSLQHPHAAIPFEELAARLDALKTSRT
jgi:putative addiction module component (TIGR02574 family)